MKKFTLLFLALFVAMGMVVQGQKSSGKLKGSGEVFYYESFDWGNPADEKGWTAPDGYYMEDPTDNGFNWHWWPNDPLKAEYVDEPAFQSRSKEDGHLCLFAGLYNNYKTSGGATPIDNTIVFPTFNFSDRASVILRYETNFMEYSPAAGGMQILVSSDAGVHWAAFNADFGVGHKDRPNDVPPGVPAILQANISEVAAGAANVIIKIRWSGTVFYYWLIDDFELAEAWNNDLQMQHLSVEWDDANDNTTQSWTTVWPMSQLAGSMTNFTSSVLNFGEKDQDQAYLEVDVIRNQQSVFNAKSDYLDSWVFSVDTFNIAQAYTPPKEYGHYKVRYEFKADQEEETPENNFKEFFMHVTDSVYSRADDSAELKWSYSFERYADSTADGTLEGHFVGSKLPIYADCEVNSISIFLTGGLADGLIEFAYSLWLEPQEEDMDPYELLTTEILTLDSSMFGTWVTLPFEKDGESEFLATGDIVYAGLTYWNYHNDLLTNRNKGLAMAADKSVPLNDPVAVAFSADGWYTGDYLTKRNLLIRLNLNDNGNISDYVDQNPLLSSLEQNYPNPFNRSTEISYELGQAQEVSIEITDMTGRKVIQIDEGQKPAGTHTCRVDAQNLNAGIYFYTLKAGQFEETKRMVVSK